jgi:preprotein translocase subunit YajC
VSTIEGFLLYAPLVAVAAWVLVVRPSRRLRAQRVAVVDRLAPGSKVLLTSGLLARVVEIDDGEVVLDAGDGVLLRYVSGAVRAVLDEPPSGNSEPGPDVSDTET